MGGGPEQGSRFARVVGPGLVFAAAAIGVSHLVQSTRAGALYGLGLVGFVLLANVLKYPAFRFGPAYAAATGTSLLEGYRRQGRWALWLYFLLTLGTMFTVLAAVSLVTAAMFLELTGVEWPIVGVTAGLIGACALLLAVGRYRLLDRLVRVLVVVLGVSTLVATVLILPQVPWSALRLWVPVSEWDLPTFLFVVALVGWMPSAIDISVWNSLWTLARRAESGHRPSMRHVMQDFHLGYVGTALIALAFVVLGAGVLHDSGVEVQTSPAGFAAQVIDLYRRALGDWSAPIIRVAAFVTMFSTTLTVLDGFPRALSVLAARFGGAESDGSAEMDEWRLRRLYWAAIVVVSAGAIGLLFLVLTRLTTFVDLATTLSFLTAPVLAWLNHRAMHAPEVPAEHRPARWLWWMSVVGVVFLTFFAVLYVGVLLLR